MNASLNSFGTTPAVSYLLNSVTRKGASASVRSLIVCTEPAEAAIDGVNF